MKSRPLRISPSILAADFARLGEEINAIEEGGADWVHIDVMDGHFVPNISFAFPVIQSIRKTTKLPFDTHLMISPADPYLVQFAASGADIITVHVEAGPHLDHSLQAIRATGKKAGAALNPGTPVAALENVIDHLDLILIMTVNPGFGGQSFINSTLEKVRQARALVAGRDIDIEVDGGITLDNVAAVTKAGANVIVAGSSIFANRQHAKNISALRQVATTIST